MTVLALTALGSMTEIGSVLFFVESPKAAKAGTITCRCHWYYHARLCKWKHSFMYVFNKPTSVQLKLALHRLPLFKLKKVWMSDILEIPKCCLK
jgi:hypothetical protein